MSSCVSTSSLRSLPRNPCKLVRVEIGRDHLGAFGGESSRRWRGRYPDLPRSRARPFLPACRSCALACPFNAARLVLLPPFSIEILRRQPALEVALAHRPFAVEHGKYQALSRLRPLVIMCWRNVPSIDEAVAQGGAPRGCIERVAFPFVAPIAQRFEDVTRQQVLGFCAERRALQRRQ